MSENTSPTPKIKVTPLTVDPRVIELLDLNAHYMDVETYNRLVENIRADGVLMSTPIVWCVHDDKTKLPLFRADGSPRLLVLSGNHRTRASVEAGLTAIHVLCIENYIEKDRRAAIQLSHNSINGEDDPKILQAILKTIRTPELKLYSGIKPLPLPSITPLPLSGASLSFQPVTMLFLPDTLDEVEKALEDAKDIISGKGRVYSARMSEYDKYLDMVEAAQSAGGFRNMSAALSLILDVFTDHLGDLNDLFFDDKGQVNTPNVPVMGLLERYTLPPSEASTVAKAISVALSKQEIKRPEDALLYLSKFYLEANKHAKESRDHTRTENRPKDAREIIGKTKGKAPRKNGATQTQE